MKIFLILLTFLFNVVLLGQSSFTLKHKTKQNKISQIKSTDFIAVLTATKKYKNCQILSIKDSVIQIKQFHSRSKIQKDTTFNINYQDIIAIKRPFFKKTHWLEPFAYISIGAALALGLTPIIWAAYGSNDALQFLQADGVLLGICIIPILIGKSQKKFDLKNKWNLVN